MTAAPPPDADDSPPNRPTEPAWREFARAPLVPVAVAVSAGLVADRYLPLPLAAGVLTGVAGLVGFLTTPTRPAPLLWLAFAGLGAAHHHAHRHVFPADDLGNFAAEEPHLARVRGVLVDEPQTRTAPSGDPLAPRGVDRDFTVIRATAIGTSDGGWVPASGRAALAVDRGRDGGPALGGLHAGDAVELVGVLGRPRPPANPGEPDWSSALLDRRVRAELRVSDSAATVVRLEAGADPWVAWPAAARGWAAGVLRRQLPPTEAAVARALLLGDTAAMDRAEWDVYVRTGVVHALAISGQHLLVLAGFAWLVCRLTGVRRSRGAWAVAGLVAGYAVLTGGRPSGVRAAVMVAAVCGGLVLRRPPTPANAFALGWLVVVAADPADPFALGCQLSFVSVFVLVWGLGRWLTPAPPTALDRLVDEARPLPEKLARDGLRWLTKAYAVTLGLAAANAPLIVSGTNLASPVGVAAGPPLVALTSVALVAGFVLVLTGPVGDLGDPAAFVTAWALRAAGWVADAADAVPGGAVYLPAPPTWWLAGFYGGLAAVVLVDRGWRVWTVSGLTAWAFVGLLAPTADRPGPDELRVTFLSVGHGGCTVLEAPDGRVLVYDAGSTAGPAAVRRAVAPYLWHRGVTRIDELFVSHADADHFNGVDELLKRFAVGQATLTPSFAAKPTAEVAAALLALDRHRVPVRVAVAGDRLTAGDVALDVLHPPAVGPPGTENERSMVLAVRYAGHTLLLTGDLEGAGTARLLAGPPEPTAVLMAPHHGGRSALPAGLVGWSRPRLAVVSRGPPKGNTVGPGDAGPAPVWDTWAKGAVTVRCHRSGVSAEAFRTGERLAVAGRAGRR